MNKILGAHSELYYTVNYIGFFVLLIFNLTRVKIKAQNLSNISLKILEKIQKKNNLNKVIRLFSNNIFWAIIETILVSCVQYLFVKSLNFGFGRLVGTGANYYGLLLFMPYILVIYCCIIRVDPLFQIDLITPAFPLALSVSKIACFCSGCCNGIVSSIGLYNSRTRRIEFPIQMLESVVALLIFIYLISRKKKLKPGTILPIYTIIYSATRFCTEFLRCQPNVFLGLKTYHILCLIGIAVGFVELFIVRKFGDKINKIFTCKLFKNKVKKVVLYK